LFHTSFSFEQSPSSIAPLATLSFVAFLSLAAPSITIFFTTHFITPLVAPSFATHVVPSITLAIPSFVVHFLCNPFASNICTS
jgi:hypothetical protein